MPGFSADPDRRVIPRWRTFTETRRLGELDPIDFVPARPKVVSDFLTAKIADWRRQRTVGHATDLVGAGITLGREGEVKDAAKFLLQDDSNASFWGRELAEHALWGRQDSNPDLKLTPVEKSTFNASIKTLRSILRAEPKDPISWVDMARSYACLGLREQADRCMKIALHLSPNNRFVLRSAGRLCIFLDDPERAHDVFRKSDRTRYDPWLLSAEIATGSIAKRPPRLVRAARGMLAGEQFLPGQISELASALATLEFNSGTVKKSKQLFRQSLEDPTENSIAQAAWAARQRRGVTFNNEFLSRPNTFEAESWSSFQEGQWERAVQKCKLWLFDQPFSTRPSSMGSFITSVALEDYSESEVFARQGLLANPADPGLGNNLAFALINRRNYDDARNELKRFDKVVYSDVDRAVLRATNGLLEFREGSVERGRQLYESTYAIARKIKDASQIMLFALALTYNTIEEASIKGELKDVEGVRALISRAYEFVDKAPAPLEKLLTEKLKRIASQIDQSSGPVQ